MSKENEVCCVLPTNQKNETSPVSKEIAKDGRFVRQTNQFTTPFGEEEGSLPIEKNRYRLIWAPVCPWAHRQVIVRKILGLEEVISLGTLDPLRPTDIGKIDWAFTLDEGNIDPVLKVQYLSELYKNADPEYSGRPTVPAVIDLQTKKVVQNDYHNLTYYWEREWKKFHKKDAPDLFPVEKEKEIRELNEIIFHEINNGVYKAGFAQSQEAYEAAYELVFNRLDWLEERLSKQRFLHGDKITDSDVRLYVTLARFDTAYYAAFNVNKKRLIDYPNLWGYARDLYQTDGFGNTTDFDGIKKHYFLSLHILEKESKPKILPKGPDLSIWKTPHNRATQFA
ncbi:putative glutathione S-transferase [Pilibacter termitis]|uniref:Putative glutathione S-transferase n=1 Tax=Pilibacter termitis TaxID=263852 RepID=A0A1T4QDP6_9ENTE|nr:glutathione S-transferase C-terminal domain-containing protein [Pilibacter termitis]SKA01368.1 putative glutathione S-transferase [Pilibacter termitis]